MDGEGESGQENRMEEETLSTAALSDTDACAAPSFQSAPTY